MHLAGAGVKIADLRDDSGTQPPSDAGGQWLISVQGKNMKRSPLLVVPFLLLALAQPACHARDAKVLERTDKFTGITLYFTPPESPKLEGGSFLSQRYLLVKLDKASDDKSEGVNLHVDASLPDWMFIESGQSLVLKINGKFFPLSGQGSVNDRNVVEGGVSESADYDVPPDVLESIANAQSVDFRLLGSNASVTGSFTPIMLADMRLFAQQLPGLMGETKNVSAPVSASSSASSPPAASAATNNGYAQQPFGVQFVKVPFTMRMIMHLKSGEGVWVVGVTPGSAAERAGLHTGDVILAFDGRPIHEVADLQAAVRDHKPGATATLQVLQGADTKAVQVTFGNAQHG